MVNAELDASDPIDNAIVECDRYVETQQAAARRLLFMLINIGMVAFMLLAAFVYFIFYAQRYDRYSLERDLERAVAKVSAEMDGQPLPNITLGSTENTSAYNIIVFAILSVFTVVFGVLMSVYRFHLNEISKTEHYKIGFRRIRIAAESGRKGYQSEVRDALTDRAFTVPSRSGLGSNKTVDSPLPGHPGADLATTVLNQILDSIEIKVADKTSKDDTKTE